MNLSENTLKILKNFSSIQPNIYFREGDTVSTLAQTGNILAKATIEDSFESNFGIWDLNEFLKTISIIDEPIIKLEEKMAKIKSNTSRSSAKYYFTSPEMLTYPSEKMLTGASNKDDYKVNFELDVDVLSKLKRAAGTLNLSHISISNNEEDKSTVKVAVYDAAGSTKNTFDIEIEAEYEEDAEFEFIINIGNLAIIPDTYCARVAADAKMINFKNEENKIEYWLSLDNASKYN